MKNIISLCVRRPVTMIMIIAAVFTGAVFSVMNLPLNRLPEIVRPEITVETAYPGMTAAGIRASVTIPLEDALSAVKGLEGIKSVSRDGASLLLLTFRWGTVPARAAAFVREVTDTVYPGLPQGASKPVVIQADPLDEPHAVIAVRSLDGDSSFAVNLAGYELRSRLRSLDGAGTVAVAGGAKRGIRIRADPARLAARSLNTSDLAEMIAVETADYPAGTVREGNMELTVVSSGRPGSEDELSAIVLPSHDGPLRLASLADTALEELPRQSLFIFNNTEQVALEVYRRPGADPVALSHGIKRVIAESSAFFSRDAEISLVYDSSPPIVRNIKELGISGGTAALAVIAVLAFFMGRLRYSMLAALALPFSASASFIALAVSGRSLNSMSLGGLALGIGLVSDTSVIVLDLFCRKPDIAGKAISPDEAGSLAASVSLSSLAGTLTTVAVFIPVLFLPGPLGALFSDLALSLTVSVSAGWFYAQFCLPPLFCLFMEKCPSRASPWSGVSGRLGQRQEKLYACFLRAVLRRPAPMVAVSVLVSAAGLGLLFLRPAEFTAPGLVTEIGVTADFPSGTPPAAALSTATGISEVLSGFDEIASFYGRMGAEADDASRRANPDYRRERLVFRCFLKMPGTAETIMERIMAALKEFESPENSIPVLISVTSPQDHTAKILGFSPALVLAVKGGTPLECSARAEAAAARLRRDAGAALHSVKLRPSGTRPQLRLIPRREPIAMLGISVAEIAASVSAASEGTVTGTMEIEGRPVDIRVSSNAASDSVYSGVHGGGKLPLEHFPLALSPLPEDKNPRTAFLGSLAGIEWIEAETALVRLDRSDVIFIDLLSSPGKESTIRGLAAGLTGDPLMPGVSRADETVFVRYRAALVATVVLVVLLLYLILGAQFESLLLPLILMLAVPFSLAGAGPALFFTGSPLDSGAVLGLVALFGLAVNNGIVLYETAGEKTRSGLAPAAAVYSGAVERFRPVLLTSLTTISALLPLVVSPLGDSQRGMVSAMLGGITVSGVLAVSALPPVFIRFLSRGKDRRGL